MAPLHPLRDPTKQGHVSKSVLFFPPSGGDEGESVCRCVERDKHDTLVFFYGAGMKPASVLKVCLDLDPLNLYVSFLGW